MEDRRPDGIPDVVHAECVISWRQKRVQCSSVDLDSTIEISERPILVAGQYLASVEDEAHRDTYDGGFWGGGKGTEVEKLNGRVIIRVIHPDDFVAAKAQGGRVCGTRGGRYEQCAHVG